VPLDVFVDGERMPEAEARAFWKRFSDYMDEHAGDLGGFARAEGFASVHPELRAGGAVLVVSNKAAQRPYANAAMGPEGSRPGSGRGAAAAAAGPQRVGGPRTSRGRRR